MVDRKPEAVRLIVIDKEFIFKIKYLAVFDDCCESLSKMVAIGSYIGCYGYCNTRPGECALKLQLLR